MSKNDIDVLSNIRQKFFSLCGGEDNIKTTVERAANRKKVPAIHIKNLEIDVEEGESIVNGCRSD